MTTDTVKYIAYAALAVVVFFALYQLVTKRWMLLETAGLAAHKDATTSEVTTAPDGGAGSD